MTTETMDDRFTNETLVRGPLDVSYLDKPDPTSVAVPPGKYYLKFGQVKAQYVPERSGENARGPWTMAARVEVKPELSIVSDAEGDATYAGTALNKLYRLDTAPLKGKNWSSLSAALDLMGLTLPRSGDPDEIMAVAEMLSGLETPVPVFVTLRGEVKYKNFFLNAEGARVYLDEALYRTGDDLYLALRGESDVAPERLAEDVARFRALKLEDYKAAAGQWTRVGFVVNGEWTLQNPGQNVDHDKVWANLEPTPFSWKVRRA